MTTEEAERFIDAFENRTARPFVSPTGVLETVTLPQMNIPARSQMPSQQMPLAAPPPSPDAPMTPEEAEAFVDGFAPISATPPITPTRPVAPPAPAEGSSLWRQSFADPAIALLGKGVVGVSQAATGIADIVTLGATGKAVDVIASGAEKAFRAGFNARYGVKIEERLPENYKDIGFEGMNNMLDALMSPEMRQDKKEVAEVTGFLNTVKAALSHPRIIASTVLESIPSMLGGQAIARTAAIGGVAATKGVAAIPGFAAKIIAKFPALGTVPIVAAAIGEGAMSAGSTAEQARVEGESGFLSLKQAAVSAVSGAATTLLGIMGGRLASKLGIGDVDQLFVKGGNANVKKNILRRVIEGALSEGALEELPQSLQEQIAQNINTGRPWDEGVAEAGAMGMLAGMVMGGGANLIAKSTANDTLTKKELIDGGFTNEEADAVMSAKTTEDRIELLDLFMQEPPTTKAEVKGVPDIEARAKVLPAGEEGAQAPAPAITPPEAAAAPEVHPNQPKADKLAERIKRPGQIKAVDAPNAEQEEGTKAGAELLGFKEVVWIDNQSGKPFSGSVSEGVLYVEKGNARPGIVAALHEAIEVVKRDSPDNYRKLADLIKKVAKEQGTAEQLARLGASMEALGQDADDEMVIQRAQEFALDKVFWAEMFRQSQADPTTASAVRRIIEKIIAFIDSFAARIQGMDPSMDGTKRLQAYFEANDMGKVRTALVEALTKPRQAAQVEAQRPSEAKAVSLPTPEAKAPSAAVKAPVEAPKPTLQKIEIPDFVALAKKSGQSPTEEALDFGSKNRNVEGIQEALQAEYDRLVAEADATTKKAIASGDMTQMEQAAEMAQNSQLPREALEAAKSTDAKLDAERVALGMKPKYVQEATKATVKEEPVAPLPEVEPTTPTPTPAAEPTGAVVVPSPTEPVKIPWTAKQIDDPSFSANLKSIANTTMLPSGISLRASLGEKANNEDIRRALRRMRREYLDATGQSERTQAAPSKKQITRPTAADQRAQEQQEDELLTKVEEGTLTTEAAATTEGVSDEFKDKMGLYGRSKDSPRKVGDSRGYRDPADSRIYAIGPNGAEVNMPKKSKFSRLFEKMEKGKVLPDLPFMAQEARPENDVASFLGMQEAGDGTYFPLYNLKVDIPGHSTGSTLSAETIRAAGLEPPAVPDMRFMAQEAGDLEAEILKAMRRRSNVKLPPGAEPQEVSPGYPRVLQYLKTVANSELTYAEARTRIETRLRDDPDAMQPGYSMERLMENSRKWIDEQGSIFDAYNAIGTEPYNQLEPNERSGVLVTLTQYLQSLGYKTGDEAFFDAADSLTFRTAEWALKQGQSIKALDMWRSMAPNNMQEAYIYARRQVKKVLGEVFKRKGRDDIMAQSRGVTSKAAEEALKTALDRVQKAEERSTNLRERLTGAEGELQTVLKGFEARRRELFKNAPKPPQAYVDAAAKKRDAALAFFKKDKGTPAFMAQESAAPASDVYNNLVLIAESRIADALASGADMNATLLNISKELNELSPATSRYTGQIIDQAATQTATAIEVYGQAPAKTAKPAKEADPKKARGTEPGPWLQSVREKTSENIDIIMGEVQKLKEEAGQAAMEEAQKKAMAALQKLADEQGITLAQAQALLWQQAQASEREDLFRWAETNLEPTEVQDRIEKNSLFYWGRVNGMPDTELNLAMKSENPLGEQGQWAKDNDIVAETPFAEGYQNLEAGMTAASLRGQPPTARQQRTEAEQRLARIKAQGRIAYELQEMDKIETGKNRTLRTVLQDIIRKPIQAGTTIVEQLEQRIIDKGWPEKDAKRLAKQIADEYAKIIDETMRKTLLRSLVSTNAKRGAEDRTALENIVMAMRTKQLSDYEFMQKFADAYGFKTIGDTERAEIERIGNKIEKLATMTGNPNSTLVRDAQEELNKYIYSMAPSRLIDVLMTFRKESMLSGFTTTVQNTVSNTLQQSIQVEVLMLKELLHGNFGNVGIILRGALMPLEGEAYREFWRILKDKSQVWKHAHKLDSGMRFDPTQFHPIFNKGGYFNPLHWLLHVFSFLQAQDYPFYLIGEGAAAANQTANELRADPTLRGKALHRAVARKMGWGRDFERFMQEAKEKGFTGKEQRQHAYELRRNSWSIEARYKGTELGNIGTYNVEAVPGILGDWSRAIGGLKRKPGLTGIAMDAAMPFTGIPFSVGNAVIANSPLGFYRAFHKGQVMDARTGKLRDVTGDDRLGWTIQATQGSLLMLSGMFFLLGQWRKWKDDEEKEDLPPIRITAYGPADSAKRAQWLAAGNEPYSITMFGKTLSYRAWSGLLGPLGAMGAMMDMLLFGESKDPTKMKGFKYRVAMNSLIAMPQAVLDQTSLMAISDMLDILQSAKAKSAQESTSKMNSLIARTVTSFVPNLFRQVENIWDPSIYPNDTIAAAFLQNIPFASSSTLNKRLNVFGEEIKLSALRQFYQLPIPRKPFDVDPVAAWLIANDISMGPPTYKKAEQDPRTGKWIERSLDEEERYRFMKIWGPMMRQELSRRIDSGLYKHRTKDVIQNDIGKWRRQVLKRTAYQFERGEGQI